MIVNIRALGLFFVFAFYALSAVALERIARVVPEQCQVIIETINSDYKDELCGTARGPLTDPISKYVFTISEAMDITTEQVGCESLCGIKFEYNSRTKDTCEHEEIRSFRLKIPERTVNQVKSLKPICSKRASQTTKSSDDSKRATTSACQASKKTCLAQCGNPSYWNGSKYVENQSWSRCNSTCESISCD